MKILKPNILTIISAFWMPQLKTLNFVLDPFPSFYRFKNLSASYIFLWPLFYLHIPISEIHIGATVPRAPPIRSKMGSIRSKMGPFLGVVFHENSSNKSKFK